MKKQTVTIIVLVVLLIIAAVYISYQLYNNAKIKKESALSQERNSIYQQGASFGYQQAVVELLNQALTCNQVPVRFQNTTLNMIAIECIQAAQAQAQQQAMQQAQQQASQQPNFSN